MNGEIRVLFCYQFELMGLDRNDVEKLLAESCEQARDNLGRGQPEQIIVRPVFVNMPSGEFSYHVFAQITEADICIFEGSPSNPRIPLILGYALGQEKPCIYLVPEKMPVPEIQEYLAGALVLHYTVETLVARLAHEIHSRASAIMYKRIIQQSQRATEEKDRDTFRAFWGLEGEQSIYLVCPEIPEDERSIYAKPSQRDYLRLAKFADIDTLFHMKGFLSRCFPGIRVFESTCNDMPPTAHMETVVTIGGVAWNKLTTQAGQSIRLPFVQRDGGPGNPDPIENVRDGSTYLPSFSSDGTVQEDIGCFVKVPNPINRERSLFIVYGVLVHGVLGAAKSFTEGITGAENCSHIMKRMGRNPHFAALLRIPVINNFVGVPNIAKRGTMIELLGYSPERNEFT